MDNEPTNETKAESAPSDIDWENRILCSDGNCIGVIGPHGLCKECGKKYDGTMSSESVPEEDVQAEQEEISTAEETPDAEKTPDDDIWENRRLCSDGNCIGVIGPDGHCKECGKTYEG
jgi:hypothetical protein